MLPLSDQTHRTGETAVKQPGYLGELQVLRFVAAALVLFGHVLMETRNLGISGAHEDGVLTRLPWGAGVDIFFVISGFIIFYIIKNVGQSPHEAFDFLVKRIIRIAPLYWFYTFLMLVAVLLFRSSVEHSMIDARHFIASLFFIAWPRPDDSSFRPFLGQGWTLNYEIFFYLVAALSILSPKPHRIYYITILIILIVVAAPYLFTGSPTIDYYTNSLTLEFIAGVWLCRIRDLIRPLNRPTCLALVGLGVLALAASALPMFDDYARPLKQGIPATMIAAGFVLRNRAAFRPSRAKTVFQQLGDASYSLYLSHPFVINGIALVWLATVRTHPLAFEFVVFCGALIASRMSYLIIEKPALRFLREKWESGAVIAASAPRSHLGPQPEASTDGSN